MKAITRLPSRPLREQEVTKLDGETVHVVPYGGIAGQDGVRIYALKMATGAGAYALGFDDTQDRWKRLSSVTASDLSSADSELDATLDDWVTDTYGRRFDVLKPR
jgi:hypothetical protein